VADDVRETGDVTGRRPFPTWLGILLAAAGLTALYAGPLRAPFLNDDYLFLQEARTRPLAESLAHLGPLGNYYRPLSRQIYFELLAPVAGGNPLVFHLVNYGVFLLALALLADLLLALLPVGGVVAGTLYFALLPFQRVNLMWVSCSQGLLALAGALAALALHRRGRRTLALVACGLAFASKEAALPLPAMLLAWDLAIERRRLHDALLRSAPCAVLAIAWLSVALTMRAIHEAAAPLSFGATDFAAAYAHLLQSLVGLEHPPGILLALASTGPDPLALLLLIPTVFLVARPGRAGAEPGAAAPPGASPATAAGPASDRAGEPPGRVLAFAAAWTVAFGVPTWPVAWAWSAYFYTLAAVGSAIAIGLLLRRAGGLALAALIAAMLWLHAGSTATRAFAVAGRPWVWTSHLTSFYFDRALALQGTLAGQLARIEPHPPHGARLFFATLPPFAGFQMGNGARTRAFYHDESLESHFYSEFSESTAADHPCSFFYWDGARLLPLYRNARDPFFQVGSDLLLLGRLAGAEHAFRRGLAAGEDPRDLYYWLGWTELWRGRRNAAERMWSAYGAKDDSLLWIAHLRAAHNSLADGDTLETRRHLITAIGYGIGRPQAHAVLGDLLARDHPKYGALELEVASRLDPRDWASRRDLVAALLAIHLDDPARRELEALKRARAGWRDDPHLVAFSRTLEERAGAPTDVIEFP
jgi:hypothetical protein